MGRSKRTIKRDGRYAEKASHSWKSECSKMERRRLREYCDDILRTGSEDDLDKTLDLREKEGYGNMRASVKETHHDFLFHSWGHEWWNRKLFGNGPKQDTGTPCISKKVLKEHLWNKNHRLIFSGKIPEM